MLWVLYALIARFLWSWTNIGDKFLLTNKVKDPLVYVAMGFLADIVVIPLWMFWGFHWYGWPVFWFMVLDAVLFFSGTFFYVLSAQREEISRVNLLWNLAPLQGLWLSWIILGEVLSGRQLIALAILLIGSVLAGLHFGKGKNSFKFSLGFWLMIMSTLLYAGGDIITHFLVIQGVPSLQLAGYQLCLLPILALFMYLFKGFRQRFTVEKKYYGIKVILFLIGIAVFSRLGILFNMKALGMGHISLINVLEGSQTIMVFILAVLFTYFAPKFLKEEWDRKNLLLKMAALVLLVVGVVVLNV